MLVTIPLEETLEGGDNNLQYYVKVTCTCL